MPVCYQPPEDHHKSLSVGRGLLGEVITSTITFNPACGGTKRAQPAQLDKVGPSARMRRCERRLKLAVNGH